MLSTIASSQTILVKKHDSGSEDDGLVNLKEIATYEDNWNEFAFCKKSKQGKYKTKTTFYYSVSDEHDFDFRKLKRDKTVMGVLKQKETFVSLDKFHPKAIKEVGFLVGLHTKLCPLARFTGDGTGTCRCT